MRRIWLWILAAVLTVGLCGCAGGAEKPQDDQPQWEPSIPQVRDLTALLSAAEVSEAVGTPVGNGVLQSDGSALCFATEDYSVQVTLLLEEPVVGAAAYMDALCTQFADGELTDAPNLGDRAFWCAPSGELFVCSGKWVMSMNVVSDAMPDEARLLAARQMAALVVERL